MEVALVDACGGQYKNMHGSIHIYEVPATIWENTEPYSLTPEETIEKMNEMEEDGIAEHKKTIVPDDVVTV